MIRLARCLINDATQVDIPGNEGYAALLEASPAGLLDVGSSLGELIGRELAVEDVCCAEGGEEGGVVRRCGGDDGREAGEFGDLDGCEYG